MYVRATTDFPRLGSADIAIVRRQDGFQTQNFTGTIPQAGNSTSGDQQQQGTTGMNVWNITIIAVVALVVVTASILLTYSYFRRLRLRGKQPRYLPGFLQKKWSNWRPKGKYASIDDDATSLNGPSDQVIEITRVDRHTSVRSVMTLPAYSRSPNEHEEVIGREGERAGMDTVVEFPETVDEEENRREEEMESLYQIRQARRQEIAERDERRRLRREARDAGDYARLEELRQEARQRRDQQDPTNPANVSTTSLTAQSLIAEHNARGRDRRVSSVSYAALGQVRHDGSRIRAASRDSESGGLLSRAAPMGEIPPLPHSRNGSDTTSMLSTGDLPRARYRDRANSGDVSTSSGNSSTDNLSRNNVRPTTAGTTNSYRSARSAQSVSDSGSEEADIVEERVTPEAVAPGSSPMPPNYDAIEWGEAPAYTEAERIARMNSVATVRDNTTSRPSNLGRIPSRAPQLPSLTVTPTIHIESPTMPDTPAVRQSGSSSREYFDRRR